MVARSEMSVLSKSAKPSKGPLLFVVAAQLQYFRRAGSEKAKLDAQVCFQYALYSAFQDPWETSLRVSHSFQFVHIQKSKKLF
jgi:hypothetical protein